MLQHGLDHVYTELNRGSCKTGSSVAARRLHIKRFWFPGLCSSPCLGDSSGLRSLIACSIAVLCPLLFSTAAHALTNIPWRVPIPQEVASAAATGRILPEGAEVSFDWPTTRSSPNYTLFAFPDKDAYDTCDFSNATQLGGAGSSTPEPPVYAIQGADAA